MLMTMMMVENQLKPLRPAADPQQLESLLHEIAQGSQEALEQLYHEAQDVMMDTYLKIRCAAHLYLPMGKPMAWILTITKNIARTRLRAASRQIPFEEVEQSSLPFDHDTEEAIALEQAMRVLNEQERQILILHAVTGLKHREIAEMMGMPLATVLSKYARSLKKLKAQLEQQPSDGREV